MSEKTLQVTLTVEQSRRLIAKALVKTQLFQQAFAKDKIILANGTSNAYIYEEIMGQKIEDKSKFTAGIITNGKATITDAKSRMDPLVLSKGKKSEKNWLEVLKEFNSNDLFIKGANAFDIYGRAGVLVAGEQAGTIGKAYGFLVSIGSNLIIPVGMEKLVPSLENISQFAGVDNIDYSIGTKSGIFVIPDANIFTELEAFKLLFNTDAVVIAAGGHNDCKGSVSFLVKGLAEDIDLCFEFIKDLKNIN